MNARSFGALVVGVLLSAAMAGATIFGNVRGIVHDPQHRPIANAQVALRDRASDWSQSTATGPEGEFEFNVVPLGEYQIVITAEGFRTREDSLTVTSGSAPVLHFPLSLAVVRESVEVQETPETLATTVVNPTSLVSREQIARAPGADRSNSLAMITDFVPSAYVSHNLLHLRGGHAISWWVDGVPVPNLSIASNVAPPFDPKDIDYLEVQRGGIGAEYGDRTFGVVNVVTRSGFERNREGELLLGYGNFHSSNDQLSFGDHTERFAYYASLTGNRSDLGLETPVSRVLHDQTAGLGGFASLIFNAGPSDQLRLTASARHDHYQIPNTEEEQARGIRDLDRERDVFVNFSWIHTAHPGLMLTVSPFYHFNRAAYEGGPGDTPFQPIHRRASNYAGAQAMLSVVKGKHNAQAGVLGFAERDASFFGITAAGAPGPGVQQQQDLWGNLQALFVGDQYKPVRWFTLTGGLRLTRFSGLMTETAASPRVGGALRLPLGLVAHASYGRFYQAPPLATVSGPLLELALSGGLGFLPLHGERDEQHEFGLTIPLRGWTADLSSFHMGSRNYFDHDVLGNSSIFLPITLERARVRGWEATVRSPRLFRRGRWRLAYAHQTVEAQGGVTGGLTDFQPPPFGGYYFLDFDQRHTLSTGLDADLPRRSWLAANVAYGSGFLEGDGPFHLPAHTTLDLAIGKALGERWSVQIHALNVFNRRFLLDRSNEFAGTHYAPPRQVGLEIRYRFHY